MNRDPRAPVSASAMIDAAARSPLFAQPRDPRRWLRLAQFVGLAVVCGLAASVVATLALLPFLLTSSLDMATLGQAAIPDGPDRLNGESLLTALVSVNLGGMAAGALFAACLIYKRKARDFLWPGRRFDARQFLVGLIVMGTIAAVLVVPTVIWGDEPWNPPVLDPAYSVTSIAIYVGVAIVGLLIAAFAEEILFRGVLLRVTGGFIRVIPVVLLVNGVLFSAVHMDPDPVAFVARTIMGITWTWAALRLGGLEFAVGAHLSNNLIITLWLEPLSASLDAPPGEWISLWFPLAMLALTVVVVERLAHWRVTSPAIPLAPRPAT